MITPLRIDKYLSQLRLVSRRDAKKFFRAGKVEINGEIEYDHSFLVQDGDSIRIDRETEKLHFTVQQSVTIILNKPRGYVCSEVNEGDHLTYKALLRDCIYAPILRVAGRLDQDTTGLVVATSDGQLNHQLTSPKYAKQKEYRVTCKKEITDGDLTRLSQGVVIDDYVTRPATTVRIDPSSFFLILSEGKFHQVKKMCEAINNECSELHRLRVGKRTVEGLEEGSWKQV